MSRIYAKMEAPSILTTNISSFIYFEGMALNEKL